ncbi:unnamed protein product [Pleuronectes platessa]|uniref:Uncharacterized protein n=1 Tax=Pleuronectes platessa TaxID=8262 RepID=A0A9N7YE23_PLEPL|nr:unnamed protein product [Pleuronectes platessa]
MDAERPSSTSEGAASCLNAPHKVSLPLSPSKVSGIKQLAARLTPDHAKWRALNRPFHMNPTERTNPADVTGYIEIRLDLVLLRQLLRGLMVLQSQACCNSTDMDTNTTGTSNWPLIEEGGWGPQVESRWSVLEAPWLSSNGVLPMVSAVQAEASSGGLLLQHWISKMSLSVPVWSLCISDGLGSEPALTG